MRTCTTIVDLVKITQDYNGDFFSFHKKIAPFAQYKRHYKEYDALTPLSYYLSRLDNIHVTDFEFYDPIRKQETLEEILEIYLAISGRKYFEEKHQKTENRKKYDAYLEHCSRLIDRLRLNDEDNGTPFKNKYLVPDEGQSQTVKFIFEYYGRQFADFMVGIYDRKTKTVFDLIGFINEKRLYWVWGSTLLKTVISLIPKDFYNVKDAAKAVSAPDIVTGTLSWGLYSFRLSVNMGLVLKHTIAGPWMSEEEKNIPWTERFKQQWDQRKFVLMNDFFWGICNLVCFFWLKGIGADSYTITLLLFDIIAAGIDWDEQKEKYTKEITEYDGALSKIKNEIEKTKTNGDLSDDQKQAALSKLQRQYVRVADAKEQCEHQWKKQQLNLKLSMAYACSLTIAFLILTLPVSGVPAVVLGTAGAILCFTLNLIFSTIRASIDLHDARKSKDAVEADYQKTLSEFKTLQGTRPKESNELKLLYLELRRLEARSEQQQKMWTYKILHFVRSVFIETLTPLIVFSSFVFFSTGAGIGIISAYLLLSAAINLGIEKGAKPADVAEIDFDDDQYDKFYETPGKMVYAKNTPNFFTAKDTSCLSDDELDNELLLGK